MDGKDLTKQPPATIAELAKKVAQAIWDASDQSGIGVLWGEPRDMTDENVAETTAVFGIGKGRVAVQLAEKGVILTVCAVAGCKPVVDISFNTLNLLRRDIKEVINCTVDAIFPKEETVK